MSNSVPDVAPTTEGMNINIIYPPRYNRSLAFSIEDIPHSISTITETQPVLPSNANPQDDPFKAVANLSVDDYIFCRRCSKDLRLSNNSAHYYYCKNRACAMNMIVYVNKFTFDTQFINPHPDNTHKASCSKIDATKATKISMDLADMRSYSIELYEKNHTTTSNATIISKILERYGYHQHMNQQTPLPLISKNTIRNWLKDAFPVQSSEMLKSCIPLNLRVINGTPWIFLESRTDNTKIYISSNLQRNLAKSCIVLLLDGTYKSTPTPFQQVLNGVGYFPSCNCYLPLFHVLMEESTAASYLEVILEIFSRIQFTSLVKINFDFEAALIKALYTAFPRKQSSSYILHGCYFHWTQAIRKKFNELYKDDDEKEDYLKAFLLLPLLSIHSYLDFLSFMSEKDEIQEFYSYFMLQWGPDGRISREYWTIYQKKLPEISTNDGVERYNKTINANAIHPSFADFCTKTYETDHAIITTATNEQGARLIVNAKKVGESDEQTRDDIAFLFPDMFTKSGKSTKQFNYKKAKESLKKKAVLNDEELIMLDQIEFENVRIAEVIAPKQKKAGQKKKGPAKLKRAKKMETRSMKIQATRLRNEELAKENCTKEVVNVQIVDETDNEEIIEENVVEKQEERITEAINEVNEEIADANYPQIEIQTSYDESEMIASPAFDSSQQPAFEEEATQILVNKEDEKEMIQEVHQLQGKVSVSAALKYYAINNVIIRGRRYCNEKGCWRINYEDISSDFDRQDSDAESPCSSPLPVPAERSDDFIHIDLPDGITPKSMNLVAVH